LVVGAVGEGLPLVDTGKHFRFDIPVSRQPLTVSITVTADSILLEPDRDMCKPAMSVPDLRYIRYECLGNDYDLLMISLDRHAPAAHSNWSATTKVTKQRRVCVEYRVDARGVRVCARYTNESYEETVRTGGVLRARRDRGD
jgi:hypothetical protein